MYRTRPIAHQWSIGRGSVVEAGARVIDGNGLQRAGSEAETVGAAVGEQGSSDY